ncbi:MAG: hypothetical protein EXS31_14735 [Pedosphaera sp.]|nr:hypothetical protein [Pedosphaera sp.]
MFRGLFTTANATTAWAIVESDLRSGRMAKKSVNWPVALRIATHFNERYSASVGTRSLDILHVSAAKALCAVEFVSFVGRQRTLAVAVGLKVAP